MACAQMIDAAIFFQLVRGRTKLHKQALRGNTWVRGDINLLATNSARNFSIRLLNSRKIKITSGGALELKPDVEDQITWKLTVSAECLA